MAIENQQHRYILEDTGSQMESSRPKTKMEMVYGHLQRLDDNTPDRQALKEALRPLKETTEKTDNNLARASEKQFNRRMNPTLLQHRPGQPKQHTPSRN